MAVGFGWRRSEIRGQISEVGFGKSEVGESSLRAENDIGRELSARHGRPEAVSNGLRAVMTGAKVRGRPAADKPFSVKLS